MKKMPTRLLTQKKKSVTVILILMWSFHSYGQTHFDWNWKYDAPALILSGVGQHFASQSVKNMKPVDLNSLNVNDIPAYDRFATHYYSPTADKTSDWLSYGGTLVPLGILGAAAYSGKQSYGQAAGEAGILAEALLFNSAINLYTRSFRLHPRPFVYNVDAPQSEKLKNEAAGSFYSGHVSGAFLVAVFTAYTFQEKNPNSQWTPYIWGGGLALATTISGLRITAGKHYPSDIVVGALMGSLLGYAFPRLHAVHNQKTSSQAVHNAQTLNWSLQPMVLDAPGLYWSCTF